MVKKKKSASPTHDYVLQRIPLMLWKDIEQHADKLKIPIREYFLRVVRQDLEQHAQLRIAMNVQLHRAKAAIEWALEHMI